MRGLSMVTINNDGFVFGGYDGGYNKEVFKISCANKICQWSTTDKVLDNGRRYTVAIPISPTLCKSTKTTATTTTKPGECGSPQWEGDQWCDDENNNAGCNWDGGDCCNNNVAGWNQYCSACECLDPNA